MVRLNEWQRAGVVASALWFFGGGLWQRSHDVAAASRHMGSYYRLCTEANPSGDFSKCMRDATGVFTMDLKGDWSDVALTAIWPILAGWVLAYVGLWVFRWIMAGRRPSASPRET